MKDVLIIRFYLFVHYLFQTAEICALKTHKAQRTVETKQTISLQKTTCTQPTTESYNKTLPSTNSIIYPVCLGNEHLDCEYLQFLANVNSSSGSLYVVVRLSVVCRLSSVVCDVRAPYSGDWNFRQYFYATWHLGHPWPLYKNFTEIVPGEPLPRGVKPKRGSKI